MNMIKKQKKNYERIWIRNVKTNLNNKFNMDYDTNMSKSENI